MKQIILYSTWLDPGHFFFKEKTKVKTKAPLTSLTSTFLYGLVLLLYTCASQNTTSTMWIQGIKLSSANLLPSIAAGAFTL